jgi:hypothetical protein
VTARDEAIEAMCRAVIVPPMGPAAVRYARALDAIPGDVLVRLAIERGALAEVEIVDEWAGSSEIIDPATKRHVDGPFYRVVEP